MMLAACMMIAPWCDWQGKQIVCRALCGPMSRSDPVWTLAVRSLQPHGRSNTLQTSKSKYNAASASMRTGLGAVLGWPAAMSPSNLCRKNSPAQSCRAGGLTWRRGRMRLCIQAAAMPKGRSVVLAMLQAARAADATSSHALPKAPANTTRAAVPHMRTARLAAPAAPCHHTQLDFWAEAIAHNTACLGRQIHKNSNS